MNCTSSNSLHGTFLVVGSIDGNFLLGLDGVLMTVVISAVLALHTGDRDSAHRAVGRRAFLGLSGRSIGCFFCADCG